MATRQMSRVLEHLRGALRLREEAGLRDDQLLGRFLAVRDEAAFAALVRRHGPMVLGVCRRVLGHAQDAEDAFQATFLVLVRKAGAVVPRERVANWLYGVAYQTALKARAVARRRRGREKQVPEMPEPPAREQLPGTDLRPLLDRELSGLPEKYRAAVVLCDLEGKTRKEAARQLGWPEGTLSGRLARARRLLARRLTRRGVALSGGSLAAGWAAGAAAAAVPQALVAGTVRAGTLLAAGQTAAAGAVAPQAAALAEGVLKAMLLTKLKVAAAVLLIAGLVGAGAVGVGREGGPEGPASHPAGPSSAAARPAKEKEDRLFLLRFVDGGTVTAPGRAGEKESVWTLDFAFHDPEFRNVTVSGRGRRTVLCLRYKVVNETGKPRPFVPQIDLQVEGRPAVPDEVLPAAVKLIAAAEDPAGAYVLHDSVSIARGPIPVHDPADRRSPVHAAALWDTTVPDGRRFSIFVWGLTNAWSAVDAGPDGRPVLRRKVLRLNFRLADGRVKFLPPRQWVYRDAALQVAPGRQPPDLLDEQRQRQVILRQRLAEVAREHIARLEEQQQSWHRERDRLRGLLEAWQEVTKERADDEAPDRHKMRQDIVRAIEQFLAAGEDAARRRAVDLELLRQRLEQRQERDRQARAAQELGGTVQEVDGTMLLLALDAEHAVRKGERLEIFRLRPRPVYVGQVEVVAVVGRRAVARVLRAGAGQGPRVGDQVARSLTGDGGGGAKKDP
jgi:RNA polymerase sigma factor (sigma-70 family)